MATGDNPNSGKHLTPFNKMDRSEAVKIQSQGGVACGQAKKKARTFQEITTMLLAMKARENEAKPVQELFPDVPREEITAKMAMVSKQYEKAAKYGDSKAFELLRDTAGEKPKDSLDLTTLGQSMQPVFNIVPIPTKSKQSTEEHD